MTPVSRGLELHAKVTIRWQGQIPDPYTIHSANHTLTAPRTVGTLVTAITEAEKSLNKDDVKRLVQLMVLDVQNVFYDQHNAEVLAAVEPSPIRWLLPPLLEHRSITRLVAKGGSFKSLFALAVALSVALDTPKLLGIRPVVCGPVLYLDWETDAATTAVRLRALCKAHGFDLPRNIHYMRPDNSLYLTQRRIKSAVMDTEPVLVIVDSNAMARGVQGEGSAEDGTIRMISALRNLGTSALVLDHKSQETVRKGQTGGYGSIFNTNLARLEWEIVRTIEMGDQTSIAMQLMKANNIRRGQELGFRFTVGEDWSYARCEPVEASTVIVAPERMNQNAEKIRSFLATQTESQVVAAIALATGVNVNTVRSTLQRHNGIFENVATSGRGHWRLVDQATDEGRAAAFPDPY